MPCPLFLGALLALTLPVGGREVCQAGELCEGDRVESGGEGHYWSWRGGNRLANGFTSHVGPDISKPPAWEWANPDDELRHHAPSIDSEGFIYMVTREGWVRKFSPGGAILWSFRTRPDEGRIGTCLSLYNSSVHFTSSGGNHSYGATFLGGIAWALGMETGDVRWRAELPADFQEPDAPTVLAVDGVFLAGFRDRYNTQGRIWDFRALSADKVVALSTTDGGFLWDYTLDGQVWNFMPSLPGDGTMLLATNCGRAYRLDIRTGQLIWKAAFDEPGQYCSTGGGALGPDGRYYVTVSHGSGRSWNRGDAGFEDVAPCYKMETGAVNCPEGSGLLLAYRVDDGVIEWKKRFLHKLNQYPAVGQVGGRLAVVVAIGENPTMPADLFAHVGSFMPSTLRAKSDHTAKLFGWQYKYSWFRRLLGFRPWRDNSIAVLDVQTGETMWTFQEEEWDHYSTSGDEEGFVRRETERLAAQRRESACAPDSWAIPVIAGDGTVYAASGKTGNLYALRDADGDGELSPGEVTTFKAGSGFVNAPALAPGLLAVAPCWGPMYVFKDGA